MFEFLELPLIWWLVGIGIILVLIFSLLINNILLHRKMKRFEQSYLSLQTFLSGKTLDQLLENNIKKVADLEKKHEDSKVRLTKAEEKLKKSIDRVELIRFNAFENMGSDLSFSLALMNQEGNGVLISSIHNREESRVYAKPVTEGKSNYNLSNEEKNVIEKAQKGLSV